jgi:hypothetical protein
MTDAFRAVGDMGAAALLAGGLFALYKRWVVLGWTWTAKEAECAKVAEARDKATTELVESRVAFAELKGKHEALLASLPSTRRGSSS